MVSPKCVVGNRVKGTARNAMNMSVGTNCVDPIENFAGRTPGEGEQQNTFGIDARVEQVLDSGGQGCGLAGARSRDHAQRLVTE